MNQIQALLNSDQITTILSPLANNLWNKLSQNNKLSIKNDFLSNISSDAGPHSVAIVFWIDSSVQLSTALILAQTLETNFGRSVSFISLCSPESLSTPLIIQQFISTQ